MMLLVVALSALAAIAAANDADCHIFGAGEYGACGDKISQADLEVDCRYNGDTPPAVPCLTAAMKVGPSCGKCYKVTMKEAGAPKGTPGCNADGCPSYTRSIMVKTIDSTGKADYEVAQNGWSGKAGLCPGVCKATSYCAEDPSVCQYGWLPDQGVMKSGCYSNSKPIEHQEVPCPGASGAKSTLPSEATTASETTTAAGGESTVDQTTAGATDEGTKSSAEPGTDATTAGSTGENTGGATETTAAATDEPATGEGKEFVCPGPGYFKHSDPHKFIHCAWANHPGFVKSCGSLVWSQQIKNCVQG